MNIGFAPVFGFRPHVEHIYYLSQIYEKIGHNCYYLNCTGGLSSCYNTLLKSSKTKACLSCSLGGIKSYTDKNIFNIKLNSKSSLSEHESSALSCSSVYSLHRIETSKETILPEVINDIKKIEPAIQIIYQNTLDWISLNRLDVVFLFNGRMDITAAVLKACRDSGIQAITVERPWLGHGLVLHANSNCLDLSMIHKINHEFKSKPLTKRQTMTAANQLSKRYHGTNNLEWRSFHKKSKDISIWPNKNTNLKVLITPSSKGEVFADPTWNFDFMNHITDGFDFAISQLFAKKEDIVFRSHPIWAQNIGSFNGTKAIAYYENWCKSKGYYFIPPESDIKTISLIKLSDVVITSGGATAMEAAGMGKHVINLGPSTYSNSDAVYNINSYSDNSVSEYLKTNPSEIIRKTLRFMYTAEARHPQLTDVIRCESPFKYHYFDKNIKVEKMNYYLTAQQFNADDISYDKNTENEDWAIECLLNEQFNFESIENTFGNLDKKYIKKRFPYNHIDRIRDYLPKGDL